MDDDWTRESHAIELSTVAHGVETGTAEVGSELPSQSQWAVDLADTPTNGELTVEEFRNTLRARSLRRGAEERSSFRQLRLRERINREQSHRDSNLSWLQRTREYKDLYWPKIYRYLSKVFSFRLWSGHLKEIEGEYGTGPVSYFVFVRFLLLINVLLFLVWFAFVCIPQISWRYNEGENMIDQPSRSQLNCLRLCDSDMPCPSGTITVYSCDPSNNMSVVINRCTDDSCGSDDRPKEGTTMVTVCTDDSGINTTRYCVFDNVDPEINGLQWIVDFVTGQGYFNRTVLFYGQYFNGTINGYDLPLSYLTTAGFVYGLFLVFVVYRMGQAYNEDYIRFGRRNDFSNRLFSAWDYHITNEDVAASKHKSMKRHFEEEVEYIKEKNKKRTTREWVIILIIRSFTNLFVLLCLVGTGTAIYFTIRLALDRTTTGLLTIETLVTSVVVSFINLFFPWLFSFLAEFERYKTTPGKINVILIRSVVVRVMPIVVLLGSWLGAISCTQPSESDGCSIDEFRVSARSQSETCPRCWETFIGQEVYRLALVNLLTVNGAVLILETGLNLLSKVDWAKVKKAKCIHRFCKDRDGKLRLVNKPTFEIPLSILDVWYTQALMWLGFFYCPYLPLITILTLVLHFYVRRYSMKFNCVPDTKPFHAARRNFTFLSLLLLLLFIILVPIGYSFTRLQPSAECGPFRGQAFMYSVVNDTISDLDCDAQRVISFFGTAGFIVPLIVLLLMIIYGLLVVMRARNRTISLLKKQLVLDEADNVHLRGRQHHS